MAITDAYATAEEYRAVISPDRDDAGDDLIESDLTAISRYLDGKLGQFFSRDDEDVTLVFDWLPRYQRWGSAPVSINGDTTRPALPPLVSVTSLTFGTRPAILASGFELQPLDAASRPEPEPYREIWPAYGLSSSGFLRGRVTLVGQRGWPVVPVAVNKVTIQIAALLRLETPRATRRIPEMGELIETSPSAQALVYKLIDRYKVWWFA